MAKNAKVEKRDWAALDPEVVGEILIDLIMQPDILEAERCGSACLQLNFQKTQFRIDSLPPSVAQKIPALVNRVRELSQVPF